LEFLEPLSLDQVAGENSFHGNTRNVVSFPLGLEAVVTDEHSDLGFDANLFDNE